MLLLQAGSWAAVPVSPKLQSLEKSLRSRQAVAIEEFWTEVSQSGGTPLVECPKALAPDCLVTFLWRGDASTTNVVVRGEALPEAPAENLFSHLQGTDLWYRTYRFRDDARFMYMFSINDPLTSWDIEGPERTKRYAGVRTDPLNRRNASYVSLPRAPSERWTEQRPGTAHGAIRRYELPSAALSGKRSIDVYATPGFQPQAGITPVLLLFDGDESRDLLQVPVILDNLFAEQRIEPMLAVFLIQPYERRESDLGCSSATNRYLVDELLPWLRKEYKIRTAPEQTVAAGASLGGLAAAYAALHSPGDIARVLSQSGAFWWGKTDSEHEWLTSEVRSSPRVNVKFYLDVGLMETKGETISQLQTNRRLNALLRLQGYSVIYREFNGIHGFPCWRAGFADALLALLSMP